MFANLLSSQREYTIAAYKYMLSLSPMDKGDHMCINMDQHNGYEKFNRESLMREHWLTCHKISVTEGFACSQDEAVFNTEGRQGRARTVALVPRSAIVTWTLKLKCNANRN